MAITSHKIPHTRLKIIPIDSYRALGSKNGIKNVATLRFRKLTSVPTRRIFQNFRVFAYISVILWKVPLFQMAITSRKIRLRGSKWYQSIRIEISLSHWDLGKLPQDQQDVFFKILDNPGQKLMHFLPKMSCFFSTFS